VSVDNSCAAGQAWLEDRHAAIATSRTLQDGNIRIGIFPHGEEILVGGLGCRRSSLQGIGTPQAEMRERVFYGAGVSATVVENLLIFGYRRGLETHATGWSEVDGSSARQISSPITDPDDSTINLAS